MGGIESFEEYADLFETVRDSVKKWSEAKTQEHARDLGYWLKLWSNLSEMEPRTDNSPSVGEIGWKEGGMWHPIPLSHRLPLAQPSEYKLSADRLRDGDWVTIVGTQIEEYTRSDP